MLRYYSPGLKESKKKSIGSWVALLRMTVLKIKGKQISSQSPVMSFGRSVVSLRHYMEIFYKTNRMKTLLGPCFQPIKII